MTTDFSSSHPIVPVFHAALETYALYLVEFASEVRETGTIEHPQPWPDYWIEYMCAEIEALVLSPVPLHAELSDLA
jgi:hypothetical protein